VANTLDLYKMALTKLLPGATDVSVIAQKLSTAGNISQLGAALGLIRGKLRPLEDPAAASEILRGLFEVVSNSPIGKTANFDKLSAYLDKTYADFNRRIGGATPDESLGVDFKEGTSPEAAKEIDKKNPSRTTNSKALEKQADKLRERWGKVAAKRPGTPDLDAVLADQDLDLLKPADAAKIEKMIGEFEEGALRKSASVGRAAKPAPLDLTPSFRAKLGPLGVSNIGDLGELTAHGKLPPELVAALNKHATGDPEDLRQYFQTTAEVPPEVVAAAQARKSLQGVPDQFAQLKQKLQEAERTIGESGLLSEKKKLAGVKKLLSEMEGVEESGDPTSMRDLLQRAKKGTGRDKFLRDLITPQAAQQRIGDIKAAAEEGNTLGFGSSAANSAEQNLARLRKAAEQLKAGAKGAAADLLEGPAKFGATSPLVENLTKAAKGTKIAPDVAKSVSELKALLAEGEPGIKAWFARGGLGKVAKGPVGMGLIIPILFEAYRRFSLATDRRRESAELDVQRESLPTVQNLLETYKAQRFAQQGVNNEAPDPRIVQALQRMGPQLTNSEVAIGPDRTMDNVLALRERLTQE